MSFFDTVKNFVLKVQPADGTSELWRTRIINSSGVYTVDGLELEECLYSVAVREGSYDNRKIQVGIACPDDMVVINDFNGDGRVQKGETVRAHSRRFRRKGQNIYTSLQRDFTDWVSGFSALSNPILAPDQGNAEAFLAIDQEGMETQFRPPQNGSREHHAYIREALDRIKAILARTRPSLKQKKVVLFNAAKDWSFSLWKDEEGNTHPVIGVPVQPEQGHNVLLGFVLSLLNFPAGNSDAEEQRALEIFTAFLELREEEEWAKQFRDYLPDHKIYSARLGLVLGLDNLKRVGESYDSALTAWQNGDLGKTRSILGSINELLDKRPPSSDPELNLALDEKARAVKSLYKKTGELEKMVVQKDVDEVIGWLAAEGLIRPERIAQRVRENESLGDFEFTGARLSQGALYLEASAELDPGEHHRLQKPVQPRGLLYTLNELRQIEEGTGNIDFQLRTEKRFPLLFPSAGWRGGEFIVSTEGENNVAGLTGGPRFEISAFVPNDSVHWGYHDDWERGGGYYFGLGTEPNSRGVDAFFGPQWVIRAWTLRIGGGLKYQQAILEGDSPHNIMRLNYLAQAYYHPFYFLSDLSRFAIGVRGEAFILTGAAWRDGDVAWIPFWGSIYAMAGMDF